MIATSDPQHPGMLAPFASVHHSLVCIAGFSSQSLSVTDHLAFIHIGLKPEPEQQICLGVQLKGGTLFSNNDNSLFWDFNTSAACHPRVIHIFWHKATLADEVTIPPLCCAHHSEALNTV